MSIWKCTYNSYKKHPSGEITVIVFVDEKYKNKAKETAFHELAFWDKNPDLFKTPIMEESTEEELLTYLSKRKDSGQQIIDTAQMTATEIKAAITNHPTYIESCDPDNPSSFIDGALTNIANISRDNSLSFSAGLLVSIIKSLPDVSIFDQDQDRVKEILESSIPEKESWTKKIIAELIPARMSLNCKISYSDKDNYSGTGALIFESDVYTLPPCEIHYESLDESIRDAIIQAKDALEDAIEKSIIDMSLAGFKATIQLMADWPTEQLLEWFEESAETIESSKDLDRDDIVDCESFLSLIKPDTQENKTNDIGNIEDSSNNGSGVNTGGAHTDNNQPQTVETFCYQICDTKNPANFALIRLHSNTSAVIGQTRWEFEGAVEIDGLVRAFHHPYNLEHKESAIFQAWGNCIANTHTLMEMGEIEETHADSLISRLNKHQDNSEQIDPDAFDECLAESRKQAIEALSNQDEPPAISIQTPDPLDSLSAKEMGIAKAIGALSEVKDHKIKKEQAENYQEIINNNDSGLDDSDKPLHERGVNILDSVTSKWPTLQDEELANAIKKDLDPTTALMVINASCSRNIPIIEFIKIALIRECAISLSEL